MSYVYQTGIRDGEYITSSVGAVQNVGTIIQVFGFYPPSIKGVESLALSELRDKLGEVDFFADMTVEERRKNLMDNAIDDKDFYLNQQAGLMVKFIAISGPDMIKRFTEDQRNNLVEREEPISIQKVYEMSSGVEKAGKKNKNMLFRPSNWTLLVEQYKNVDFDGIIVDIEANTTVKSKCKISTKNYILVDDADIALLKPKTTPYNPTQLASNIDPEIEELIKWFSPSVYKSLLQKIIRTRTPFVEYLGQSYDGKKLLTTCICMLMRHPGTYEADMHRHTSGFESSTKRLAVTIAEDGYTKDPHDLLGLFAAAYIAKKASRWRPSYVLVEKWLKMAVEAWDSNKMYDYVISPIDLKVDKDPLVLCYHILKATGSLSSDIPMLGQIANNKGIISKKYNKTGRVVVPIVHCIDQHNIRDLAWHFPYETAESYSKLFHDIWDNSSSINPRKRDYKLIEEGDFMNHLRLAQYEIWLVHSRPQDKRETLEKEIQETFVLDKSWLSALVGPLDVWITIEREGKSIKILTVCVIDPNKIDNFIVVPKPIRTSQKASKEVIILTEDEKEDSIEKMRIMLKKGVVAKIPPSLKDVIKNVAIVLRKKVYYVGDETWEVFRHFKRTFPLHSSLKRTRLNAILYTGEGIETNAKNKFVKDLKELDGPSRSRLLTYLSAVTSRIELYKISLDGTGTYYQVSITDTAVYNFLAKLCIIYPAFIQVAPRGFKIKYGPGAWRVFDLIRFELTTEKVEKDNWKTPKPDSRSLFDHQKQAVEKMTKGGRHYLIYITPGLGKTLIAMNYIVFLIKEGKMPKYCVYTLPESTITSVMKEFETYKFSTNLLDLRKKKGANTELKEGYINFIRHDHLRMRDFSLVLGEIANELFFLVDEFHLALANNTERTSVILGVAKTAKYLVGMTGTLVTDDKVEGITQWLSLISKFEVTPYNYWCAMGLLIASRIQTKVVVERRNVHLEMSKVQKEFHDRSLEEQKFETAVQFCYEIIKDAIVEEALDYIKREIGVFIVAKDKTMQDYIANQIIKGHPKANIFKISSENSIHHDTTDKRVFDAIITTPKHNTGYTITKLYTTIQSVYFGNQATRTQLEARTNRLGQENIVEIITIHTGVLTYILERYEKIKSLADFVAGFANVVDVKPIED